jgi:hypothetical protein
MDDKPNSFFERGGAWVVIRFLLLTAVIVLGVAFHGEWTHVPTIAAGALLFILVTFESTATQYELGEHEVRRFIEATERIRGWDG